MFLFSILFTISTLFFFSITESSVLQPRTATDAGSSNLVLPVNVTNFLNQNASIDDATVLPNTSYLDDDIVWPENTPAPSTLFPPTNTSSLNTSSLSVPKISCNGKAYGRNLNVLSCLQAWSKMIPNSQLITFGERGHGDWGLNLPFRIQSMDGKCAIDISHRKGVYSDSATSTELKENAALIINICVDGTPNEGGIVSNIGTNGNLAIRITPYVPSGVQCDPPGNSPLWNDCRNIIDFMPVEGTPQIFGQKDDPDQSITWRLPAGYNTRQERCQVRVDSRLPEVRTDKYDWYKLWAAANAVDYMCVQLKRSGSATGLGESFSVISPPFFRWFFWE